MSAPSREDGPARRISVVLPVYNERENIAPCLRGLARALANVEHELLVCYDFDEDTTLEGIRAMGAEAPRSIRLVKNTLGRGPHKAIQAGFHAASGDAVVTTMADLSDPPELIPRMAERIRAGADVVSGSRYMAGGSQKGGPWLKRTLSRIAGVSLRWLAGVGTHDATSNFRAYSKRLLDSTTIESTAGFEIALELTVKAHLAGMKVDEVPSSWTDRSAGQSRFRLWKWLPNYLRWYGRAMREPACAWLVLLVATWAALWSAGGDAGEPARIAISSSVAACALVLCAARALRGRNTWIDALHPLLWLAPPALLDGARATTVLYAARAIASALTLFASVKRDRAADALRAGLRRVDQRGVGIVLLVVLVWASHLAPVTHAAAAELDPSWQQSLGRALHEELRFGSQILFTYGPLGWFVESPFDPALFWTKALVFEIGFKLLVAGFVVAAGLAIPGTLERTLWFAASCLLVMGNDAWAFVAILAVAAWSCARVERSAFGELLGALVLGVLALSKFTYLLYAVLAVLAIAGWRWRARGPTAAWRAPLLFLAVVVGLWAFVGQSLLDLPRYLWTSLAIARGYSSAMSFPGTPETLQLALLSLGVVLVGALASLPRDPLATAAPFFAALVLAGGFLAFKAGFVRSFGNAVTTYGFAAAAPLLLTAVAGARTLDRTPVSIARTAIECGARVAPFALAVHGYGLVRESGSETPERLFLEWSHESWARAGKTLHPRRTRDEVLEESRNFVHETDLPGIRERVGRDTVDLFGNTQGVLHRNELAWKPRPAFQSYVAYTKDLLRRNAEFLAGADAPRWLLFQFETVDQHLPQMDDTLAVQVIARAWRPVYEEGGYLLLEKRDDATEALAHASERTTQIAKTARFGEWVELGDLDGRCHLLRATFRPTLLETLGTAAYRATSIRMQIEDSERRKGDFRVVPAMLAEGVLVDPFMIGNAEWLRWFEGGDCAHVRRLRFTTEEPGDVGRLLEDAIELEVVRADDLVPPPVTDVQRKARFPMFTTAPNRITTKFPWYATAADGKDVLVVHAPSDLVFEIKPGTWRLTGRYGILAEAWEKALTDGVSFAVVAVDAAGKERQAFKRLLDPTNVASDRGPQTIDVTVTYDRPGPLWLRTRPGPRADSSCDWAWWTELAIERVPSEPPR